MESISNVLGQVINVNSTKQDISGWLVIVDPKSTGRPSYRQPGMHDRIRFTYFHDNFSESKSANYASTAVLGRSEPIRGYMNSTPRTVNLQLAVPIEGDDLPSNIYTSPLFNKGSWSMESTFQRKLEVLDFIRSLVYPHYTRTSGGVIYPPPRVLVVLGTWFTMLGLVSNWSMNHKGPWAVEGHMAPFFTDVTITIEECGDPYSFQEVYNGILRYAGRGFGVGLGFGQ